MKKKKPLVVFLLGVTFIILGLYSATPIFYMDPTNRLISPFSALPFCIFGILLGVNLIRLQNWSRLWTIGIIGLFGIFPSAMGFIMAFSPPVIRSDIPQWALLIFIVPFLLLCVYLIIYLTRPRIKECFSDSIVIVEKNGKTIKKKPLISKSPLFIIIAIIVWIPLRAALISREGPRIVKIIKEYKEQHGVYPDSLEQIGIKSILSPMYHRETIKMLRDRIENFDSIDSEVFGKPRLPSEELENKKSSIASDEFDLMYSIFVFDRWGFNSSKDKWYTLD